MPVPALVWILSAAITLASSNGNAPQDAVVLTRLTNPIYPTLARQTRISGDVELAVEVRADGAVTSATVVKGHPLLVQAA